MLIGHREILTEQNTTHCHYLPLKQHELLGVTQIQAYFDGGICYQAKLSPEAAKAEPRTKEFLNCQSLLRNGL